MEATLTAKGQITIPKSIRDQFALQAGDKVEFILMDHLVFMIPANQPIQNLRHILPPPATPVTLEAMEEAIAQGRLEANSYC
jgi:antitoxin PrlF